MRAIDTRYNGYLFRSRTEARWGVFFDEAGIDYEYEGQGLDLQGHPYLPDFWLPEPHWWIEIKGRPPSLKERKLARLLMLESGCDTHIFCGQPATVENGSFAVWTFPALGDERQNERGQKILDELAKLLAMLRLGIVVWSETPEQEQQGRLMRWEMMGTFDYALTAARKARFEHEQKGAPRQWAYSGVQP